MRRGTDLHVGGKSLSGRVSCIVVNLASLEENSDAAPVTSLVTTFAMDVVAV